MTIFCRRGVSRLLEGKTATGLVPWLCWNRVCRVQKKR